MVTKPLLAMNMKVSPFQLHSINSSKFKFNATSTLNLLFGRHTGTAAAVADEADDSRDEQKYQHWQMTWLSLRNKQKVEQLLFSLPNCGQ